MDRARVNALLHEFDTSIAPQKHQLEQSLPNIWRATYGPPASLPAAGKGGIKRGAAAAFQAQKPRTEEQQRRVDALLKQCMSIIVKKLYSPNFKFSVWFKAPVDPIKLGIPNYFIHIKKPMDLGTIRSKLQSGVYRSPMEFKEDVDLVWSNCAAYNHPTSDAGIAGRKCQELWERSWRESGIAEQWAQLEAEMDPSSAPLPERCKALNSQLAKAVEVLPGSSQPEGRGREMTFAEKRRLSARLLQVQPDLCPSVMEIVSQDAHNVSPVGDEVELEIDALRPDTLWRLQELLDRPLGRHFGMGYAGAGSSAAAAGAKEQQHGYHAQQQSHGRAAGPSGKAGGAGAVPPGGVAGSSAAVVPSSSRPGGAGVAEKSLPARELNGANSVHSSGAGSDSDSGDGSHEVKGSTMDGPNTGAAFVRDGRTLVDESATNPKEQSQFVKDRAAARKAEVNVNPANWDSLTTYPSGDAGAMEEGAGAAPADEMWNSFQTMEEKNRKKQEQAKREEEEAERRRREDRDRLKREDEEKQRKLKEEEDRQAAEMQRQRDEQMQRELDEIKAQAGTANLTQQGDVALLAGMAVPGAGQGTGLAALGLDNRDNDEDMNFEDD